MEKQTYQDAAFYCDGDGHAFVLALQDPYGSINIYCDGQMRVWVNGEMVRTAQGLFDYGITAESDIDDLEWENNPWFAAYDEDGNELFIEHTLDGAVTEAARILAAR